MDREWNDSQPIYRQLRDRVVAMILDGVLKEGDPLPSVRNVAAEYRVNPLTVLKGYQQLVDEGLVESRRGLGMFINAGAHSLLLQGERQKFLAEEWPRVHLTIERLGLTPEELDAAAKRRSSSDGEQRSRWMASICMSKRAASSDLSGPTGQARPQRSMRF
jgi:GntR family transcriptional regulator